MSKIALVVSHPIQHFCPQYVSFAQNEGVEFKVFFGSKLGLKKYFDANFKQEISWGDLGLNKFENQFVNGDQVIPSDKNLDAPVLDSALAEFNPELVIIYGYFQKLQRRTHRWAIANGVRIGYISDSEFRHGRNRLKEMLKYFFIKRYFSSIDYFLSVGNANEDFYRYYGVESKRIVRMHFPINIIHYEKSFAERHKLRERIRDQYKINSNEVVLSIVGKLVSWKNQDHIIDSVKLLEERGVFVHLFILGSGDLIEILKQKASSLKHSVIHFTGFTNPEELPAYYAATDIYVHSAAIEPHSLAVSEAIYMGCPIILSDRCGSYGVTDDVQESRNGFVYEFGNREMLANKIEILINDAAMRFEFGLHSIQISRQFQNRSHYKMLDELKTLLN
jgi:glycosyltransferase involved in cell wall biosynthesis